RVMSRHIARVVPGNESSETRGFCRLSRPWPRGPSGPPDRGPRHAPMPFLRSVGRGRYNPVVLVSPMLRSVTTLALLATTGCSLDWTIGATMADARVESDGGDGDGAKGDGNADVFVFQRRVSPTPDYDGTVDTYIDLGGEGGHEA